jgi:hypothetical protein
MEAVKKLRTGFAAIEIHERYDRDADATLLDLG